MKIMLIKNTYVAKIHGYPHWQFFLCYVLFSPFFFFFNCCFWVSYLFFISSPQTSNGPLTSETERAFCKSRHHQNNAC